ncbi:tail completion protein gp17 [Limnoglobus roseus]|uniref:DUF3168 domain-containing protein n=1 Tax=Limnoglobus roseus TaxID=2598579 RepID=A0A5C1AH45_9BACT|nr:DUF3168 domain-containing protein [Limnoglobus roseus]QEL18541.1 hypothetical protein PX52LOC_05568 [Limnoglobus roseus]
MTVEETIVATLAADPDLVQIVGARVYAVHIPEHEYPLPWVMYRLDESEPVTEIDGTIRLVRHSMQFDVLATEYNQARTLEAHLVRILHDKPGKPRPALPVHVVQWTRSAKTPRDEGFQVEVTFELTADHVAA